MLIAKAIPHLKYKGKEFGLTLPLGLPAKILDQEAFQAIP
jgi:hypothetical protein